MKVISFKDSSIQAYGLGKALSTYTDCVVGAPMYTKGLVLRIEAQYNSFYILLFLYNYHKECSVLYLMHAHTCVHYRTVCNFKDSGTRGLPAGVHLV